MLIDSFKVEMEQMSNITVFSLFPVSQLGCLTSLWEVGEVGCISHVALQGHCVCS